MTRSSTKRRYLLRLSGVAAAVGIAPLGLLGASIAAAPAGAAGVSPTDPSWCSAHGSTFAQWSGTTPEMPICGPGPAYGGTWAYVVLPGPTGQVSGYYNATPGFQCVELAERFLAVAHGLAPVLAEGSTVAQNYHAAYPTRTELIVNGTPGAIGHAPRAGDVVSFSFVPNFDDYTDGHVAVIASSSVNSAGNGTVVISQENVGAGTYVRTLDLESWRLVDPESGNPEWDYPYAEWLSVDEPVVAPRLARVVGNVSGSIRSLSSTVASALRLPADLARATVAGRFVLADYVVAPRFSFVSSAIRERVQSFEMHNAARLQAATLTVSPRHEVVPGSGGTGAWAEFAIAAAGLTVVALATRRRRPALHRRRRLSLRL